MISNLTYRCFLVFSFIGFISIHSFAGSSGRITGRVYNSTNQHPLQQVSLTIHNRPENILTDETGDYDISGLTPGHYTLTAVLPGYRTKTITGIHVQEDNYAEVDVMLNPFQANEEPEIEVAGNTGSTNFTGNGYRFTGEDLFYGPFRNLNELLSYLPGINAFDKNSDRPQIRGSDLLESMIYLDGMPLTDEITNQPYYYVNFGAIEELQIIPGGFSAEYGNARSGIINIITREGGDRYHGSVNVRYSQAGLKHFGPMMYGEDSPINRPFVVEEEGAFTGNTIFEGWNQYAQDPGDSHPNVPYTPYELYGQYLWRHRSPDNFRRLQALANSGLAAIDMSKISEDDAFFEYGLLPDWQGEINFGGPLPFMNRFKFFVSHRCEETEYGLLVPEDSYRDRHTFINLTGRISGNIRLNINGFYGWQTGSGGIYGLGPTDMISSYPYGITPRSRQLWSIHNIALSKQTRYGFQMNLTHTLSPKSYYQVHVSRMVAEFDAKMIYRNTRPTGLWEVSSGTYLPRGFIGTEEDADASFWSGANWRDFAKIKIGEYWYDEAYYGFDFMFPRDATGFYKNYFGDHIRNDSMTRFTRLKANYSHQWHKFHEAKIGFEYIKNNPPEDGQAGRRHSLLE